MIKENIVNKYLDLRIIRWGFVLWVLFGIILVVNNGGFVHQYLECPLTAPLPGCYVSEYEYTFGQNNTLDARYTYILMYPGEILGKKPSALFSSYNSLTILYVIVLYGCSYLYRRGRKP